MAILRPMITPTVGIPQAVVASRRPRNMTQKDFYSIPARSQAQRVQQLSNDDTESQTINRQKAPLQDTFEQEPMTGDFIAAQLEKINQTSAAPQLMPGDRVKSPEAELVQPSNFQKYYEQLATIRGASQEQTAAAAARTAFQRAMQSSGLDSIGLLSGLSGYNFSNITPTRSLSKGGNRNRGGGNQAFGSGIPSNPAANFKFAQELAQEFGWGPQELQAWYTLGMKESGWRNNAQNPTSTAYGIGQFLNSTWAGVGIGKTSDPRLQVLAMARYIKNRYGSPSRALGFHLRNNWY